MDERRRRWKLGSKSVKQKSTNTVVYADELDQIQAEIMKDTEVTILNKLLHFSKKLLRLIYTEKGDFIQEFYDSEEIMEIKFYPMLNVMDGVSAEMYVRAVMQTVKIGCDRLRATIRKKTADDYPKFLGARVNLWRYMIHLTEDILKNENPEFSTCFIAVNVCLIELICCCQNYGLMFSFEECGKLWVTSILHFFGDRFKNIDPSLVLRLASNQLVALNRVMEVMKKKDTEPGEDKDSKRLRVEELRRRLQLAKEQTKRRIRLKL